ncbi:MAG: hypothetical protein L3J46_04025 [Kangiellaceae bacterium]|nr:hypothetical protein [Kangiellaceae bacterium]
MTFYKNLLVSRKTKMKCVLAFIVVSFSTAIYSEQAISYSPLSHYFMDGKLVGSWQWIVGNKSNYYVPVDGVTGKTEDSKLSVTSAEHQGKKTAIKAIWEGGLERSSLYLQRIAMIDLEEVKDQVAISAEYLIEKKDGDLRMAFLQDCKYPCRAEIDISKHFKSKALNKWFTFPIPLNCFTNGGLDAKKIVSPFMLSTSSKLTLRIANVRLILLPKGEKGCV